MTHIYGVYLNENKLGSFRAMNNNSESRTRLPIESYSIAGPVKGVCLIFANAKYSGKVENLSESGVNKDINTLKDAFECLGFHVHTYQEKTTDNMRRILQDAKDNLIKDFHSMLVVCFVGHGCQNFVMGTNSQLLNIWDEVIYLFTGDRCSALHDKPKLIIQHTCQTTICPPSTGK